MVMDKPPPRPITPVNGGDDDDDDDDDRPINVLQLLRKDIITPGGRDIPASNVLLSITTPNPYSTPDGDGTSVGPGAPSENSLLKKHYHVIGADPPIDGLTEDEGEYVEAADDSSITPSTSGSRLPLTPRRPVMVMPVQAEDSDHFEGGDQDTDDDDLGGMYDVDGQSTLVAARQGVGIHEPMCPPSRLPPIDEGPASHRSYTGSGNHSRKISNPTATFSDHKPTIFEEDTPRSSSDTPHSLEVEGSHCSDDTHSHSRSDTPSGRRSSLGLLYKMEGNKMVAIPDIVEQVETGSGTVDKKPGVKKNQAVKGRKPHGVRLKPLVRSAGGRRGSAGLIAVKGAAALAETKKKRPGGTAKGKHDKGKPELMFTDEEEFKPTARVKVTRVDIPELLPPGELEARTPGHNELLESPGRSYHNAAYEDDAGGEGGGEMSVTPRKVWLEPAKQGRDVWGKVSNLWKLGTAWPDRTT